MEVVSPVEYAIAESKPPVRVLEGGPGILNRMVKN